MPSKFKRSITRKDLSRLAALARIPEPSRKQFGELVRRAVVLAHLANEARALPHGPASDVTRFLTRVKTAARHLDTTIAMLYGKGVDGGQRMAAEAAGMFLDQDLHASFVDEEGTSKPQPWKTEFLQSGTLVWLTEYRRWLARLIAVSSTTEQRSTDLFSRRRGRPHGVGGNPRFDEFVRELLNAARNSGGRLTLTRNPYADRPSWTGTLIKAVKILEPYLPRTGFFPDGNLGYALERVSKRFKAKTAKIRSAP
jgi:hypothetical protein